MTSDDVKFTLERLLDDKFASPNKSKVSGLSAIEVPDATTVRLVTKEAFAPLLTFLANARTGTQVLSRKAVGAAGDDFGKKPIGTGAYSLKDWVPGERVSLAAFPGYFGGAPKIATIDMPLIAEEFERRDCAAWRPDRPHLDRTVRRHSQSGKERVNHRVEAGWPQLPVRFPQPPQSAVR